MSPSLIRDVFNPTKGTLLSGSVGCDHAELSYSTMYGGREWFHQHFAQTFNTKFVFHLRTKTGSIYTITLEPNSDLKMLRRSIGARYKSRSAVFYQSRLGHVTIDESDGETRHRYDGRVAYCLLRNRIAIFDQSGKLLRGSSEVQEVKLVSPTLFQLGG